MTRISTLLIGAGLVALQGCAATGSEEDIASTSSAVTPSGSATLSITSDWGAGYCANVVLTNALSVQTARWQVLIDFKGLAVPAAPWNTTFVTNGKYTTAQPATYNTEIAPNGTASFGFCGTSVAGGVRPSIAAYNMEMDLFTTCSSNSGTWPTLAALAVSMATELGRWEPDLDLQVSGGKVILNPAAVCVANSCKNTKAILGQQSFTADQSVFNNTNYASTLQSMFTRQSSLIANLKANNPTQVPIQNYKTTLVGGPTNLGYGNCGPHYIFQVDYSSGANSGKPLSSTDATNLLSTLCFYGDAGCGPNPYIGALIGDVTKVPGCPAGKMCIAIDPTDGDNGSTSTTTAGSAPTYPKNMVYDPANDLLGTACITTKGKLGTLTSQCAGMPDTCGNLYCIAN
jgi:hypothetical protein